MTRPLVTFPRVESVVVDFLAGVLTDTVAARLPSTWTPTSSPVLAVGVDATPEGFLSPPVSLTQIVRLVAWSDSPTESHDLAMLAAGHMEAHDGEHFTARLYTGPLPAVDPSHGDAQLCAVTLRCRVRSIPVT